MRVLLIDGSNYLHRGHWAIAGSKKEKLETSEGFPTSGIKGMLNIILADIRLLIPDRVIVCYDKGGAPTWRHIEYPEYKCSPGRLAQKAKAKASGNNVYEQLRPTQLLLKAMGVRQIGVLGEEADDIIGTLAVMFSEAGHEVLIGSSDKDFGSLVNRQVKIVESLTRRLLGIKGVQEKFGVKPSKMVEYLMLQGDAIDNIPGVFRCGSKTAAKLLNEYGTLKEVVANASELTPALQKNLLKARKVFKWTRRLLTIKTTVEHKITCTNCNFKTPDYDKIAQICKELELKELHKKITEMLQRKHQWK